MFKKTILILLFFTSLLYAQNHIAKETGVSFDQNSTAIEKLKSIDDRLKIINEKLQKDIWTRKYSNYITYHKLLSELKIIEKKIKRAKRYRRNTSDLEEQKRVIQSQLSLLEEYKESPFMELLKPENILEPPTVKNPIAIIGAFSYIKQVNSKKSYYKNRLEELKHILALLKEKKSLLDEKYKMLKSPELKKQIKFLSSEIDDFETAVKTSQKTIDVYEKRVEEVVFKVTEDIKLQTEKTAQILAIIVVLFIINILIKWGIRKYIKDSERFYMANKAINFTFATIIILILLFAYIENVSYIVTILGFASAGIAIAMKDMFMSLLGWTVIVFGGSIHVGDRIRVKREGQVYVGDVVDISLLRMTILEDITLTSYRENTRSGRIIFVPNNYIFTDLIANYTHSGLKTVWDNVNFYITFESNHKKANHIAKEIARKYAKGYIDITRKQLNKLRSTFHLKNTNVDVRVYTFAESYGYCISVWFMTNSYATLTLRSTISTEIIDRFLKEDDITIAYPTQTINLTKNSKFNINTPKELEV